jgi:hypothetical protein
MKNVVFSFSFLNDVHVSPCAMVKFVIVFQFTFEVCCQFTMYLRCLISHVIIRNYVNLLFHLWKYLEFLH